MVATKTELPLRHFSASVCWCADRPSIPTSDASQFSSTGAKDIGRGMSWCEVGGEVILTNSIAVEVFEENASLVKFLISSVVPAAAFSLSH